MAGHSFNFYLFLNRLNPKDIHACYMISNFITQMSQIMKDIIHLQKQNKALKTKHYLIIMMFYFKICKY